MGRTNSRFERGRRTIYRPRTLDPQHRRSGGWELGVVIGSKRLQADPPRRVYHLQRIRLRDRRLGCAEHRQGGFRRAHGGCAWFPKVRVRFGIMEQRVGDRAHGHGSFYERRCDMRHLTWKISQDIRHCRHGDTCDEHRRHERGLQVPGLPNYALFGHKQRDLVLTGHRRRWRSTFQAP